MGPETFFEIRGEKAAEHRGAVGLAPGHVGALALVREIFQAQAEGKRRVHVNDAAKFIEEFRLAVGGEAHHFVFVAEFPEAEILRERGVIHAERMRESDFAEVLHARAFAQRPHGAGEIAEAVGGKDGGTFERRDKIGAGEMCGVMFDAMKLRLDFFRRSFEGCGEIFVNSGESFHHARAIEGEFGHAHRETQFGAEARPGIARDGDVVHFGKFYARLIQAILDRAHGQAGRVFHAVQALFFDGGEQVAVGDNRGGGVGVVRVDAQDDHLEYCGGNLARCLRNKLEKYADLWGLTCGLSSGACSQSAEVLTGSRRARCDVALIANRSGHLENTRSMYGARSLKAYVAVVWKGASPARPSFSQGRSFNLVVGRRDRQYGPFCT